MPELGVRGLDAFYGDFQALYGVDLAVAEGEVVAVIGANGAGKSTLMRSISGLMRNRGEQVVWGGRPIGGLRADEVGLRPRLRTAGGQHPLLPPHHVDRGVRRAAHYGGAGR